MNDPLSEADFLATSEGGASCDVPAHFSSPDTLPLLVDINVLAALLTVSPRTVYRLVKSRQLPKPLKIGTLSRWPATVVPEFIETLREQPPT